MSPSYIAELYTRNAWGAYKYGFIKAESYLRHPSDFGPLIALFSVVAHVIFLPLTTTLVAGFKTLFDVFTRNPLASDKLEVLKERVGNLDNNGLDSLSLSIQSYMGKSNSSQELSGQLKETSEKTNEKIKSVKRKARTILLQQKSEFDAKTIKDEESQIQEEHNIPEGFVVSKIISPKNTPNDDSKIDKQVENQTRNIVEDCKIEKADKQRSIILGFLTEDKNAGKRMQHVIYNHFFKPVEQSEKKPEDKGPDLSHIQYDPTL